MRPTRQSKTSKPLGRRRPIPKSCFFVFVVMHNVFYALGQMAADINILGHLLDCFHAVFFLIAILVCPAGFLVGVVGSIVATMTYFKKKTGTE